MKENTKPFWSGKQNKDGSVKVVFHPLKMSRFLKSQGWGFFQTHDSRTSRSELFHNDDGIIRLHNEDTGRRWVMKFLENVEEDEFHQGGFLYVEGCDQLSVLDAWINITQTTWNNVLRTLDIFSEEGFSDTTKMDLFRDESEAAYIQFLNGVVKVTKDDISLIPLGSLSNSGAIWESEQIKREIHIEKVQRYDYLKNSAREHFKDENMKQN